MCAAISAHVCVCVLVFALFDNANWWQRLPLVLFTILLLVYELLLPSLLRSAYASWLGYFLSSPTITTESGERRAGAADAGDEAAAGGVLVLRLSSGCGGPLRRAGLHKHRKLLRAYNRKSFKTLLPALRHYTLPLRPHPFLGYTFSVVQGQQSVLLTSFELAIQPCWLSPLSPPITYAFQVGN